MGNVRRTTLPFALLGIVACASSSPRTVVPPPTTDACGGRLTTNVGARLAAGALLSALRVSEWACVDEATRRDLIAARAWLAVSSDPEATIEEARAARERKDHVLAKRLFDRAAFAMQRAGSPPRWEHPGPLSPAGDAIFLGSTRVASAAGVRVALTDVATGTRVLLWPRAESRVVHLAASADGRFLAADTEDEVLVWDGSTFAGRLRARASFAGFAPNGRTLVLADGDALTLWDASTRHTIAVIASPGNQTRDILYVGGRLVAASDHETAVIDPATGEILVKLPPAYTGSGGWSIASSPDGSVLLRQWLEETGDPKHPRRSGVDLWDTRKWRRSGTFETGATGLTARPVFSRDGARLFAPMARWLGVFDIQRRRLEVAWPVTDLESPWQPVTDVRALASSTFDDPVESLALTPDERRVVACMVTGCEIVDWRTGRHAWRHRLAQARVLPNGSILSRSQERPGSFDVLDPAFASHPLDLARGDVAILPTSSDEWQRSHEPFVALAPCGKDGTLRVSTDRTAVVKPDEPGRPCVWTRDDGHLRPRPPELPDFAPVTSLDLSGTQLLVVGAAGWVSALDLETGDLAAVRDADVARLRARGALHGAMPIDRWPKGTASLNATLVETSDGVLVREPDGGAFVVDTTTGEKRWELDAERRARGSPVALAGGRIALATGSFVDVWDATSHERTLRLDCGASVEGIALDASAGRIAANCNGRILEWELATGATEGEIAPPTPTARLRAFALGGGWVVASVGSELVAWQGRSPADPRWRWPDSNRTVVSMATDGHVVAVAHAGGDVEVYSLADGRERPTARFWNALAPEVVLGAADGPIWAPAGGFLSLSRCMRGDREVPKELCESLWVQDDLWRRQTK